MKIQIDSSFSLPAARVWEGLLSPETLDRSGRPFLKLFPHAGWPAQWEKGSSYHVAVRLCGFPFAADHRLTFLELDRENFCWVTDEASDRIPVWQHSLKLRKISETSCAVEDSLEIQAGPLTILYAILAKLLYVYRRRALRRLL